jgi:enoyl-CoA hydratase/carnithine racemase
MSFEHLSVAVDGRMAVVRLSRPVARNALSQALMRELLRAARELGERTDIDVVLLTGDGNAFSAGADLRDSRAWADPSTPLVQRREIASLGYRMCRAWEQMQPITIAAIEGYAVGGALALSLACDWRVLAEDAWVSLPEIALGIPLTWGTLARLTALVGPARAKRLTILCERVPARDALAMGLVDELAAPGQALQAARVLADKTLAMPAAAVRMSKENINAVATALHHASGHMAHDQLMLAAESPESRAAREAALKRR